MTKSSHDHLREAIRRMEDPAFHASCIARDRSRLARILNEARNRVKANKAKNAGVYIPEH